jgi:hypothetical protein
VECSSATPFVPLIGANGLYRAFDKAFSCITLLWASLDPDRLLLRPDVRRRFMEGGFSISVVQRIGRRFLESINILGPLTANLTATTFLKMITSITLIHELLFWREWISNGYDLPLSEQDIETACRKFSRSFSRRKKVLFIGGEKSSGFAGWTSKQCYEICVKAVSLGRSDLYEDFTKKSFCIS